METTYHVRHAASGETLNCKVKAVDRLHTSLELLLLGARRAAKDLSPARQPKWRSSAFPAAKDLESQDKEW